MSPVLKLSPVFPIFMGVNRHESHVKGDNITSHSSYLKACIMYSNILKYMKCCDIENTQANLRIA